jgi:hypothetical protein
MRSTTAFLAHQTFRTSHSLYIQSTYSIVGSHASQYQGTIKACGVLPFWRRVETVRHYAHHTVDKRTNLSAQSQPGNDKEVISESSKEKTAWSSHESSSEFITHYLEPKHTKRTVRDAISSILAKDTQKLDGTILNSDLEALVKEGAIIDSSLWHDPGKFPAADSSVKQVLSPHQLLALGSIWFLPASSPRDPALGGKVCKVLASKINKWGSHKIMQYYFYAFTDLLDECLSSVLSDHSVDCVGREPSLGRGRLFKNSSYTTPLYSDI